MSGITDPNDMSITSSQGTVLRSILSYLRNQFAGNVALKGTALTVPAGTILGSNPLLHVRDEKSSGTVGGAGTATTWNTHALQTIKTNEITGASLGTNQITLPAGTYRCSAWAAAFQTGVFKIKLYNTTASADVSIGSSARVDAATNNAGITILNDRFTLAAQGVLELRQWINTHTGTSDFGSPTSITSTVEVYAEVMIWQLA